MRRRPMSSRWVTAWPIPPAESVETESMPRAPSERPMTTTGTADCRISSTSSSLMRRGLRMIPSTMPLARLRTRSVVDCAVSPVVVTTTR